MFSQVPKGLLDFLHPLTLKSWCVGTTDVYALAQMSKLRFRSHLLALSHILVGGKSYSKQKRNYFFNIIHLFRNIYRSCVLYREHYYLHIQKYNNLVTAQYVLISTVVISEFKTNWQTSQRIQKMSSGRTTNRAVGSQAMIKRKFLADTSDLGFYAAQFSVFHSNTFLTKKS